MYEFRSLLDRFWIRKDREKDLYFQTRRALPQYRRIINEFLGWNLIVNESIIKLEKVPPRSMAWMGIGSFLETMDYCLLCALLLYLEDQDDGEQFLLSSLTTAVETYVAELCPVDWTRYAHRKSMVRVLRYAQDIGLLMVYDGSSEGFSNSRDQEVLYENTGLSRHFTLHFSRDISNCQSVEDFEAFAWEGDSERGRMRINRVYRQLTLSPALYWSEGDRADYEYVKNQRQWLDRYLDEVLRGELQIHKNGAYFVLYEEDLFGACHPSDLSISDATLILCAHLREQVKNNFFPRREDEMAVLTMREFRQQVAQCREQWGGGWSLQLRGLSDDRLCQELLTYLVGWMMVEDRGDHLLLCPAVGKWVGHYTKGFVGGKDEEESSESLEDA